MLNRRVVAAVALAAALTAAGHAERLAPGEPILVAAAKARAVVLGTVATSDRLDARAFSAELRSVRVVHGTAEARRQTIVWEQPATSPAPRLAAGERILVALDPLPSSTLWKRRDLPPSALMVAGGGFAYVVDPDDEAVDLVAGYLALSPADRAGDPGQLLLAQLVEEGDGTLAPAALRLLDRTSGDLSPAALTVLADSAGDPGHAVDLRAAIVRLFGSRRVESARPVVARLAAPGSALEPDALEALAAIDGALPEATVARLLAEERPALRAVGARWVRGSLSERTLPALVRSDPDPGVRAAAAAAAAASGTAWGLDAAVTALADAAPEVRSSAAQAIARLGEIALPALRREIDRDSASAPGAIATLAIMGSTGHPLLVEVAGSADSERLRGLALLALGVVRDEHH